MSLEGAAFGLFPIMWIVVNAVWIYNMTVETGHFAVLRRSFARISDDQRIQAVIIAFSFGALIEGLAGFGTPVAITVGDADRARLLADASAAALSLIGNTAPVAFGAIAIADHDARRPDIAAGRGPRRHGRPPDAVPRPDRAADPRRCRRRRARRAPDLARGNGRRRRLRARPVRVLELHLGRTDRHRLLALLDLGAIVGFLRVWQPSEPLVGEPTRRRRGRRSPARRPATRRSSAASACVTRNTTAPREVVGGLRALHHHRRRLRDRQAGRPGRAVPVRGWRRHRLRHRRQDRQRLRVARPRRGQPRRRGALGCDLRVLVLGLAGHPLAALRPADDRRAALQPRRARCARTGKTLDQLKWAIVTVAAVLGAGLRDEPDRHDHHARPLARGRPATSSRSCRRSSAGSAWRSPARTPRRTRCSARCRSRRPRRPGYSDVLLAAANSSGGVLGKMISPQNLAIGAAAVGHGRPGGRHLPAACCSGASR